MNVVFVYNPRSGSALSRDELVTRCAAHTIEVTTFIAIEDGYETALQPYIEQGHTIAVFGGDGTLSSVAKLLTGSSAIMAPLAGGTLNHFTKDLGIAQDLDEALDNLSKSKPQPVDVAMVNNIVFLNNSSIGLYPNSLQTREALTSNKLTKWFAAIVASIQALVKYRIYTVTINDETFETPFLFVGNNDYHFTEADINGRTNLQQGILSVYGIATASRWGLVGIAGRALVGQLNTTRELKIWKTTHITIHTKRSRVRVARDGELEHLATPLEYKIIPAGLTVLGID